MVVAWKIVDLFFFRCPLSGVGVGVKSVSNLLFVDRSSVMLYLIGLGLADEQDITLRGLNAIQKCTRVYLESYTSILHIPKDRLESFHSKTIIVADREMVESQADDILHNAQKEDVAFLVVGDPFG
jgi:precorrin-2 methylase